MAEAASVGHMPLIPAVGKQPELHSETLSWGLGGGGMLRFKKIKYQKQKGTNSQSKMTFKKKWQQHRARRYSKEKKKE